MKSYILSILFIFLTMTSFGQEVIEEDYSINGQFEKIYRTSTTYQVYKVIGKDKYQNLKKNVLDSLKNLKNTILEKESLLKKERENILNLNASLNKTKTDLNDALKKENSISLFGTQISKIAYNLTLWTIVISLSLLLTFFIFKFSRSNVLTKKAQENLEDIEQEFEKHRKKSIEREQKLRRQLQDEINKHRNS